MEGLSFRPFDNGGSVSPFWDVKENKNDPLVLDAWRHRQVADTRSGMSSAGNMTRGLGTLDATLSSLREDHQRSLGGSVQRAAPAQQHTMANAVSLGEMGSSAFSGMPLDLSSNVAMHPQQSIAELSDRRREAIKAAFRRVDVRSQSWVTVQDIVQGLQRFSNLPDHERDRVVLGLCGGGALGRGLGSDMNARVSYAMFAGYYQLLGTSIERDRDFEDLLRHHWGFSEVSDILDDMKNKFAMVGLAYAFRRSLEPGASPDLTVDAFQQAIGHVGMQYSTADVRRLFDAFSPNAAYGSAQTLEVLRLTQHLTSAPRPSTPMNSLPGAAHISEVNSNSEVGHPGEGLNISMSSLGGLSQHLHSHKEEAFSMGYVESKLSHTSLAPAEGGEAPALSEIHAPLPTAPPEDTHGTPDEMPDAPPERDAYGKLPLADTTEAPPEDDDGDLAPEETDADDGHAGEPPEAPRELDLLSYQSYVPQSSFEFNSLNSYEQPMHHSSYPQPVHHSYGQPMHHGFSYDGMSGPQASYLQPPSHGNFGPEGHHGSSHRPQAVPQPVAQPAQPVQLVPTGQRKAVTVGINYIGTENQLSGCINDSDTFIGLLTEDFGFSVSDIRQLRDDHPQRMPTRKNITAALHWLVKNAQAGDHLFFHYSGHGSQQPDTSGDEIDQKDETIVPCDFRSAGMLIDDDLRHMLVDGLPRGARLTVIMDCCHSGTGLDLAYKAKVTHDGSISIQKKSANKLPRPAEGEIVMLSGCKDSQTSADISGGVAGNKAAGAMTTAFKSVISKKKDSSYHSLLIEMREFLKKNGFVQVPQLCMEFHLNFMEPFLPEADPPHHASVPAPLLRAPQRRALTIGINYLSLNPGQGRLSGCINDSETIITVLKDVLKFDDGQICRLRDDRANMMPTKANILASMQWLTQGAGAGDELFLHYSGHGGQQRDANGDEMGGKDDTLIPCDFQTAGVITDDELYAVLVEHLPKGCRMWVVFDCCHSGTALDLAFKAQMSQDGKTIACSKTRTSYRRPSGRPVSKPSDGEVIMISGCKDDQTSADVSSGSLAPKASGAMTTAFRHIVSPTISCEDLLIGMRQFLKRNNFAQVPQMSSDQFIQLDSAYVNYETKGRNKPASVGFVHQHMAATRDLLVNGIQDPRSTMQSYVPMPGSPMPGSPMHHRGHGADNLVDSRINRLEEQIHELRQHQQSPLRGAGGMMSAGFNPMLQRAPPSPIPGPGVVAPWASPMSTGWR